jgi:hypothetical protein
MAMTNIEKDLAAVELFGMESFPNGDRVAFEKLSAVEKRDALQLWRAKHPAQPNTGDTANERDARLLETIAVAMCDFVNGKLAPIYLQLGASKAENAVLQKQLEAFTEPPVEGGMKSFSVNHVGGARTEYTRRTFMPCDEEESALEYPRLVGER